MRPAWYVRRLARMSPVEVAGRTRDAAVRRAWRRRQVRPGERDPLVPPDLRFVTPLAAQPEAAPHRLPAAGAGAAPEVPAAGPSTRVGAAGRTALLAAADALLAGRWPVFARTREDMAPAPDWFADPRTGRRAPDAAYCFDLDHRDEARVGNVKYVWETSRHQHVTVLAAAWHLTGDARYAEAAAAQLRSWWAANPFLSGVHWTSGIEVGVRVLSWVWARRLLDGWAGAPALFEEDPAFRRALCHHVEYLATFPSRGSSANNHLVAELAGLFAATCAFAGLPHGDRRRDRAGAALGRALVRQTFPDGLNRELATAYHGFVLELGLVAALEGEAAGCPLGVPTWDALRRMTDALAAVVDVRLRPPRQGDDDEGHGLLVDDPAYDRWASLLATGDALFGRPAWWPRVPADDVRTALLAALARPPALDDGRPGTRPSRFADAGLALLRDTDGRPDELWCRVDGGPHGHLSIAAHAHADALAVELRVGGVDVLADPGTYCYHGEPDWRAAFRGTRGHNTLEVAGADQSTSGGPFLWTRHARTHVTRAHGLDDGTVAAWEGAHTGYARLRPAATHHRAVRLDRAARRVEVEDRLLSDGTHDVVLAFHLGPDVTCRLTGGEGDPTGAPTAHLTWPDPAGDGPRTATLALPAALAWTCVRGRTDPPAGWYSPRFDVRVPAVTLYGAGRSGDGRVLRTVLALGDPRPPAEADTTALPRLSRPPRPQLGSVP
jgi:hypothetical protein